MTADFPLYDDPAFFDAYQRMRAAGSGLNEELEQPALRRLLPDVAGLDVLDLGCGDGAQAERLAAAGARSVLGVDPSARMLERARRRTNPRVRYVRAAAEELSLGDATVDLVVSSLALHYIPDLPALIARVAAWLRPGGHLVYSVEHPVCTAQHPMTGWPQGRERTMWPVTAYGHESAREQLWFDTTVTKFHHKLSTHIAALTTSGLTLTALDEPQPTPAAVARRPDLAEHLIRPPLLVMAACKPTT